MPATTFSPEIHPLASRFFDAYRAIDANFPVALVELGLECYVPSLSAEEKA